MGLVSCAPSIPRRLIVTPKHMLLLSSWALIHGWFAVGSCRFLHRKRSHSVHHVLLNAVDVDSCIVAEYGVGLVALLVVFRRFGQ